MKRTFALALVGAAFLLGAPSVYADCITGGKQVGHSPIVLGPRTVSAYGNEPSFQGGPDPAGPASIVGLWQVTFFVDNTSAIWDQGYEQWHADGTEFTMDVAVPPAAGNICVGVWKPAGKSVKLHHVGFNWDLTTLPGTLAGTFILDMTVTLNKTGDAYSGNYVSDSFDLDGNKIDALHAAGNISATRIIVQ
jgi:hypothetical protein